MECCLCICAGCLVKARSAVQKSSGQPLDPSAKSSIVRSLYTVGLMCNHFNLKDVGHICGEVREKIAAIRH